MRIASGAWGQPAMTRKLIAATDGLDSILVLAWKMLEEGAARSSSAMHTGVLATVADTGCAVRTVVLRRVIADQRTIVCHTDRRSPKVSQIAASSALAWLFYDPRHKLQIRVTGTGRVPPDEESITETQWQRSRVGSRRCYLAPSAPGTLCDAVEPGFPASFVDTNPTAAQSEAGRANFAVVECQVDFLDILQLGARGHVRAQFRWSGSAFAGSWVAP
jgi:hypothetical protein